jgi:hypothetical protein
MLKAFKNTHNTDIIKNTEHFEKNIKMVQKHRRGKNVENVYTIATKGQPIK